MTMFLGAICDDFTGASDLANTLALGGMSTRLYSGVPSGPAQGFEAAVLALKTRSVPVSEAVEQSTQALNWLSAHGAQQIFFKYCSTFDSTPDGNIGAVIDILADALSANVVTVCPAFPGAGRSVFQGHLFVGDRLLNESGMQNHPLTPMSDPDIRRWLALQSKNPVGHVGMATVSEGANAVSVALTEEGAKGNRLVVVDAITDEDLRQIGAAVKGAPIVTGGSGLAIGLPVNFGCVAGSTEWSGQSGKCVALSGSCSTMTRRQVEVHATDHPIRKIEASDVIENKLQAVEVADWLMTCDGIPLAYTSVDPKEIVKVQSAYGMETTAEKLEGFMSDIAKEVVVLGATRLITAGGETSGAIVRGLGISSFDIGPEIAPGVPAMRAGPNLVVALKSGNFGDETFFAEAAGILAGDT
jgi:uncharacterized protein YgbK (DUF1537 family)